MTAGSTPPAPVRQAEADALRDNPQGPGVTLAALRNVMLFTITDVFGLVPEESMWAGWNLDTYLAPLLDKSSDVVPMAVRQEMLHGTYSRKLSNIEERDNRDAVAVFDPRAARASVDDWAKVFMQMITACYRMRPLAESTLQGQIVGLLRELGVDHPTNPRPSKYLPNDVRSLLGEK